MRFMQVRSKLDMLTTGSAVVPELKQFCSK
jgi:hypothetical protein